MRKLFYLMTLVSVGLMTFTTSCKKDNTEPEEVRSRFTPQQDVNDPYTWSFDNESLNAVSYAWDFGDGTTSTDESPSHTYAAEGTYTVSMTATGADGSTHTSTQEVNVVDPTLQLKKLTGETSKVWKLSRDIDGMNYPIEVGPENRSEIWFALGLQASIATRPCLMEEEYIFSLNGDYEYRPMDDLVWAEEGVWPAELEATCVDATVGANMVNKDGADISAWGPGMFTFDYDIQAEELTLNGTGAHVGSAKVATDRDDYNVPQSSITYKVVSLDTDGPVDFLVLETEIPQPGYWRFVLVSYDDPNDEPELPNLPEAIFGTAINGQEVTFTNGSINSTSYSWDFGDGNTSTETSPVHTYATDGVYTVTLTATGDNGSNETSQTIIVCTSNAFTAVDLHGGGSKTWKMFPNAAAFKVGPCKGCGEGNNWWASSLEDLTIRACAFDDTWTFNSDGTFSYVTNGDIWGEAYMNLPNGACANTADLNGGSEPWGDGSHTFTVAEGDPTHVTVTGTGAFIGLPKAYNGGEHSGPTPVAGGSVEYEVMCYLNDGETEIVVLTIDISGTGDAWWTFTLQAE